MVLILNLQLTRLGDEAWGFRLIGGVDFKMPLTVVKVQPYSPAEGAGLRNGDTLLSISGRCADALTHDSAHDVIMAAHGALELEIARGRYDPVLDDQEPLFEQIDQMEDESVDFVPLSDPSEVFTTIPDLSREPSMNTDALSRETSELADFSRSLTASPFVLPSKPYRPFSTEPIPEVPPLEEPIVLNPQYHDEFGQPDDEDFLPKSKFKLPISEQYDPGSEGKSKTLKKDSTFRIDLSKKETEVKEDLLFMKQMKQDIDLDRMETTASTVTELTNVAVAASTVVEESLFKAVTVAEEIKKEIDVELSSGESNETKSNKMQEFSESIVTSADSEHTSNAMETTEFKQSIKTKETSTKVITEDESKSKKDVIKISQSEKNASISTDEKIVSSNRQEVEESIIASTVKQLSSNFEKEIDQLTAVEDKKIKAKDAQIEIKNVQKDKVTSDVKSESSIKSKQNTKTSQISATTQRNTQKCSQTESKAKFSTNKLLSEQRAYTIGLQTIPNIKGKVHSSYHYDLLLKTFFIHLTDVMVALSRFILAENISSLEKVPNLEAQTIESENYAENENISHHEVVTKNDYEVQNEIVDEQLEKCKKEQDDIAEVDVERNIKIIDEELFESRKISGAEMAQRTSQKSEELSEKMGAVITEFRNKTEIEKSSVSDQETLSIKERQSRSKSRIEEEVSKESDPLEWLSKKEEAREVIADTVQACKAVEEVTQSKINITESLEDISTLEETLKTEKRDDRRSKSKDRNTYIAIVESHVYTNKDTILEEHLSGGSSIQNSAEVKESEKNVFLEDVQLSKSTEKSKQVTKEEVSLETATVSVEKTKKIFLDEANEVLLTNNTTQHSTKVQEQAQTSTVQEIAEKLTQSETKLDEIIEQATAAAKPTEITKADVLAPTNIKKEVLISPVEKFTQISTIEKTMSESHHESNLQSKITAAKFESNTQETHQVTQRTDANQQTHQLSLDLKPNEYKTSNSDSPPSTIDTPTPATIPPTPLTDEYVFRLEIPLPKTSGLPSVEDPEPSPEKESDHEDLTIVQRKWDIDSPTIETVTYDPPLATPVEVTDPPKFANAVLSEASGDVSKEEILEIGRKSSLLASAIDETIKCIEEYKEQVGMETRRSLSSEETKKAEPQMQEASLETKPMYNGIVAEAKNAVYTSDDAEKHKENWSKVTEQFRKNGKATEIQTKASESTLKESSGVSSVDVASTGVAQSFMSQDAKEAIDTPSEIAKNASNIFENTLSWTPVALTAEKEKQDFVTSSLVSQNTDAVNKVTEYSTRSLETGSFVSETAAETQRISSSYEAQSVETNTSKSESVQESQISIDELEKITQSLITQATEVKTDPLEKIRSVPFNPEELKQRPVSMGEALSGFRSVQPDVASNNQGRQQATPRNVIVDGEVLATHQGIISGVDDPVVDKETANELGKPGLPDEKIAEIMSGESEMLREAHVMGLSRVIASHMTRVDENDCSVDFNKIKPTIETLKDSEVLKALNEELTKTKAEVKKDERKWTTFLQKPDRPQPQAKFGYHGWLPQFIPPKEQYKVKIVKQPKPKVAPDYKPEDFETGLLPWELRAATEPPPPPVSAEDPILIPEEEPEFYEAVDPLQESEVPDLEQTGIPLPPEKVDEPVVKSEQPEQSSEEIQQEAEENNNEETQEEVTEEQLTEEMDENRVAEQLLNNVQSMVDPNASLEQQLSQMRAQLAALAQLPGVIQQSLELVTRQLMQITQQDSSKVVTQSETVQETVEQTEVITTTETIQESVTEDQECAQVEEVVKNEVQETRPPEATPEELERMRQEEQEILEEQRRIEKQKKELLEQIQLEQESRQLKQRPTPRVGRPKPAFGPLVPAERPLVLPGGRKWRKPKDAYNEQFIAETLQAQAEIIQGKTKGLSYESVLLPYDERINFMKYEKPPVSLEHLRDSDVYKMVHGMDQCLRKVEMLAPVVAESDYREKCRSQTPCGPAQEHLDMPQQVAP